MQVSAADGTGEDGATVYTCECHCTVTAQPGRLSHSRVRDAFGDGKHTTRSASIACCASGLARRIAPVLARCFVLLLLLLLCVSLNAFCVAVSLG